MVLFRQRYADRLCASGGDRFTRFAPDLVVSGINHGSNMGTTPFIPARWRLPPKVFCWDSGLRHLLTSKRGAHYQTAAQVALDWQRVVQRHRRRHLRRRCC